jgi:hypothetical protein
MFWFEALFVVTFRFLVELWIVAMFGSNSQQRDVEVLHDVEFI